MLVILLLFFNLFSKSQALLLLFNHKVKSPEDGSVCQRGAEKARHSQMKQPLHISEATQAQQQHWQSVPRDSKCWRAALTLGYSVWRQHLLQGVHFQSVIVGLIVFNINKEAHN